ncbi:MAG: gluconate 2-dehydrogenase subunit 3 family protein [Proteobacteria bacterium]|nr:gluconate 2-dehydrogenase subunit 3 family protein [Pseudomonadota bacterium]
MHTRREFLKAGAGGATLTLAFSVGGGLLLLTPAEARVRHVPWSSLTVSEAELLQQLAEALAPGAAEAGVGHFVDQQLGVDPDDCMLIAKYFQVLPPYLAFYRSGLAAVSALAGQSFGKGVDQLDAAELNELIGQLARPGTRVGSIDVSMFYLCLRSDAVDVVYGTPKGFERLGVPYMAHIMPPERWHG